MSTQADLGAKAIVAKDYASAITHYTSALKTSNSPIWLIQRSIAYHRAGEYDFALRDAEAGVLAARLRARRELIASAQMRRAIALYSLGRLGDSRLVLTWVRKLNEKEKSLGVWQLKVSNEYERLAEDADGRAVTVKEIPDEPKVLDADKQEATGVNSKDKEVLTSTAKPSHAPIPLQTPKQKIRHEWYQSSNKVTITIFAKGVSRELVDITITTNSVEVQFPIDSNNSYNFIVDPLYGEINESGSSFSVTPNKLEIILEKTNALKWSALESATKTSVPPPQTSEDPATVPLANIVTNRPPVYPTSSKHGPKNWDSLARSALAAESTNPNKLEAENDIDDEGDPLHGFFQKLYKDADPDTKRAMMKSYTESNGTALSTNWDDVKKKKVETSPPDGLEVKNWEK